MQNSARKIEAKKKGEANKRVFVGQFLCFLIEIGKTELQELLRHASLQESKRKPITFKWKQLVLVSKSEMQRPHSKDDFTPKNEHKQKTQFL